MRGRERRGGEEGERERERVREGGTEIGEAERLREMALVTAWVPQEAGC